MLGTVRSSGPHTSSAWWVAVWSSDGNFSFKFHTNRLSGYRDVRGQNLAY